VANSHDKFTATWGMTSVLADIRKINQETYRVPLPARHSISLVHRSADPVPLVHVKYVPFPVGEPNTLSYLRHVTRSPDTANRSF
jgi:hypothetical protein